MSTTTASGTGLTKSTVPARLDRLPWTKFHWTVVFGLGVSWILDGLEIQLVSASGYQDTLHMTNAQVAFTATIYLFGQVVGALGFGRLADRLGRKRFFMITLLVYLIGSGLAGLSPNIAFLYIFRFIAGLGIGGEYTAINSAIDEIIPSRFRGRVDIAINGTYWAGAAIGAAAGLLLYNKDLFNQDWGWRIGFFIGPVLGLIIIYLRRHIPESPRWQLTHGHGADAERNIDEIEQRVEATGVHLEPVPDSKAMTLSDNERVGLMVILRVLFRHYPKRTFVAFTMMVTQAFLYNAIFFTYALVLKNFYHVTQQATSYYFFPFAIGNLIGPLVLGPLFDSIGRRKMIFGTYVIAAAVLAVSAALFSAGTLTALTQTILWCISFFFASAGASSAYLTVSETFPLEIRSQVISYFFAIGQLAGAIAPAIFGILIGNGTSHAPLAGGYYFGAAIMAAGGIIALIFGVNAERQSLEDVTEPISVLAARR
jgi:MFS family permease